MTDNLFSKTIEFYDLCLAGQTDFKEINLAGATLDNLMLLQKCVFDEANLSNASIINAHILGASMKRVDFSHSNITNGQLKQGDFQEACFSSASLIHSNFSECNLCSADLSAANLTEANFAGADLRGANLTDAIILSTNLRGAIYDEETQLPSGFNPNDLGMELWVDLNNEDAVENSQAESTETTRVEAKNPVEAKTKEIYYRGQKIIVEPDQEPAETPEIVTTYKEVMYRGRKTLVETQTVVTKQKKGMKYRGADAV